MWANKDLKTNAKDVLRQSYWYGVCALLIYQVISGLLGTCISSITLRYLKQYQYISVLSAFVFAIFISIPLSIGVLYFFMRNRNEAPKLSNIAYTFGAGRYLKIVGAMAWMTLLLYLWLMIPVGAFAILAALYVKLSISLSFFSAYSTTLFMLLVILAGLIILVCKGLAYGMVPFILTDNSNIGFRRALKLSILMTKGQRGHIFGLCLSFIGWFFLAAIPIDIGAGFFSVKNSSPSFELLMLGFIFILPYVYATFAELYIILRENAVNKGFCTPQELNLYRIEPARESETETV